MKKSELKGKYEATATIDSEWVLENTDKIINNIKNQVEAQGGEIEVNDDTLYIKDSIQFFKLPNIDKIRRGIIEFRSKDFIFTFTDSNGKRGRLYCDKPKGVDMLDNGFITVNFKKEVTTWELNKSGEK